MTALDLSAFEREAIRGRLFTGEEALALLRRLRLAEAVVAEARQSSASCYVGFKEHAAEVRDRLRSVVDAYDAALADSSSGEKP